MVTGLTGGRAVRIALSKLAYERRKVRVAGRNLAGCDHLVSTRRGLFAVNPYECRLVAHGLFYGITIRGREIFAFEACDRPRAPTRLGRVIRLQRAGDQIVSADVYAEGFDNGCHQIDLIGETLFLTDTYNQRVLAIGPDRTMAEHHPLLPIQHAPTQEYAHLNSLIANGGQRLVLLHNGAAARQSEVAVLDASWAILERRTLLGRGCHSFAILEDGNLLSCGSMSGELIGIDGLKVKITDLMTRGLSVSIDTVVVGGSTFSERDTRDERVGMVYFLDRNYRQWGMTPVPGPPMDIRRIDGADLSLSNHVAAMGLAVRWPRRSR